MKTIPKQFWNISKTVWTLYNNILENFPSALTERKVQILMYHICLSRSQNSDESSLLGIYRKFIDKEISKEAFSYARQCYSLDHDMLYDCHKGIYAKDFKKDLTYRYRYHNEDFRDPEGMAYVDIFREVMGYPYDKSEYLLNTNLPLTPELLYIAEGIYQQRSFEEMPILGDMLEDIGCKNIGLLEHLHDKNTQHMYGCWAMDVILNKGDHNVFIS